MLLGCLGLLSLSVDKTTVNTDVFRNYTLSFCIVAYLLCGVSEHSRVYDVPDPDINETDVLLQAMRLVVEMIPAQLEGISKGALQDVQLLSDNITASATADVAKTAVQDASGVGRVIDAFLSFLSTRAKAFVRIIFQTLVEEDAAKEILHTIIAFSYAVSSRKPQKNLAATATNSLLHSLDILYRKSLITFYYLGTAMLDVYTSITNEQPNFHKVLGKVSFCIFSEKKIPPYCSITYNICTELMALGKLLQASLNHSPIAARPQPYTHDHIGFVSSLLLPLVFSAADSEQAVLQEALENIAANASLELVQSESSPASETLSDSACICLLIPYCTSSLMILCSALTDSVSSSYLDNARDTLPQRSVSSVLAGASRIPYLLRNNVYFKESDSPLCTMANSILSSMVAVADCLAGASAHKQPNAMDFAAEFFLRSCIILLSALGVFPELSGASPPVDYGHTRNAMTDKIVLAFSGCCVGATECLAQFSTGNSKRAGKKVYSAAGVLSEFIPLYNHCARNMATFMQKLPGLFPALMVSEAPTSRSDAVEFAALGLLLVHYGTAAVFMGPTLTTASGAVVSASAHKHVSLHTTNVETVWLTVLRSLALHTHDTAQHVRCGAIRAIATLWLGTLSSTEEIDRIMSAHAGITTAATHRFDKLCALYTTLYEKITGTLDECVHRDSVPSCTSPRKSGECGTISDRLCDKSDIVRRAASKYLAPVYRIGFTSLCERLAKYAATFWIEGDAFLLFSILCLEDPFPAEITPAFTPQYIALQILLLVDTVDNRTLNAILVNERSLHRISKNLFSNIDIYEKQRLRAMFLEALNSVRKMSVASASLAASFFDWAYEHRELSFDEFQLLLSETIQRELGAQREEGKSLRSSADGFVNQYFSLLQKPRHPLLIFLCMISGYPYCHGSILTTLIEWISIKALCRDLAHYRSLCDSKASITPLTILAYILSVLSTNPAAITEERPLLSALCESVISLLNTFLPDMHAGLSNADVIEETRAMLNYCVYNCGSFRNNKIYSSSAETSEQSDELYEHEDTRQYISQTLTLTLQICYLLGDAITLPASLIHAYLLDYSFDVNNYKSIAAFSEYAPTCPTFRNVLYGYSLVNLDTGTAKGKSEGRKRLVSDILTADDTVVLLTAFSDNLTFGSMQRICFYELLSRVATKCIASNVQETPNPLLQDISGSAIGGIALLADVRMHEPNAVFECFIQQLLEVLTNSTVVVDRSSAFVKLSTLVFHKQFLGLDRFVVTAVTLIRHYAPQETITEQNRDAATDICAPYSILMTPETLLASFAILHGMAEHETLVRKMGQTFSGVVAEVVTSLILEMPSAHPPEERTGDKQSQQEAQPPSPSRSDPSALRLHKPPRAVEVCTPYVPSLSRMFELANNSQHNEITPSMFLKFIGQASAMSHCALGIAQLFMQRASKFATADLYEALLLCLTASQRWPLHVSGPRQQLQLIHPYMHTTAQAAGEQGGQRAAFGAKLSLNDARIYMLATLLEISSSTCRFILASLESLKSAPKLLGALYVFLSAQMTGFIDADYQNIISFDDSQGGGPSDRADSALDSSIVVITSLSSEDFLSGDGERTSIKRLNDRVFREGAAGAVRGSDKHSYVLSVIRKLSHIARLWRNKFEECLANDPNNINKYTNVRPEYSVYLLVHNLYLYVCLVLNTAWNQARATVPRQGLSFLTFYTEMLSTSDEVIGLIDSCCRLFIETVINTIQFGEYEHKRTQCEDSWKFTICCLLRCKHMSCKIPRSFDIDAPPSEVETIKKGYEEAYLTIIDTFIHRLKEYGLLQKFLLTNLTTAVYYPEELFDHISATSVERRRSKRTPTVIRTTPLLQDGSKHDDRGKGAAADAHSEAQTPRHSKRASKGRFSVLSLDGQADSTPIFGSMLLVRQSDGFSSPLLQGPKRLKR